MEIERLTRRDVPERIDRLRGKYQHFEVDQVEVENDQDFFDHGLELARDGWRGDAGALVRDREDRVLLIRHAGSPDQWGHPGGGHEPGETMEETALREVREETGIQCELVDVNYVRRQAIHLERDPEQRFHMLTVIFDAEYRGGSVEISDDEVLEATWHRNVPDNAIAFVQEHIC